MTIPRRPNFNFENYLKIENGLRINKKMSEKWSLCIGLQKYIKVKEKSEY